MPTCPNGHQSGTDDWCEVCGMRIAVPSSSYGTRPPSSSASASASASSSPVSTSPGASSRGYEPDGQAAAEVCPQCGTPREGMALFCEECRFNFQTHTSTTFVAPPAPPVPPPTASGFPPYPDYGSQRSRPSQVNRPAEPLPSQSVTSGSGDFLLDPPSSQVKAVGTGPAPVAEPEVSAEQPPAARPTPTEASAAPPASATRRPIEGGGPEHAPSSPAPPPFQNPYLSGEQSGPSVSPGSGHEPPAASAGTAWVAVIGADREYFTAMMARSGPDAEGLYFPAFSPEIQLPLIGNQITIGRRRQSTGEAPDIDLSRPPGDPGVSHQHAVLVQQPDGSWAVVDQDSTNGTTVNLGEDAIRPYTPIPLFEGDRVHVGAWTTITLRRA
ncbi:FHA domain-containing protein [Streptomyces sp. NPDC087422]|uniref:FHA domain-containing protein n=1 Tax=Streptomyces sp. NPDC087422 TaxID=3365786 RepID=UPI00380ED1AB